MTRSPSRAIGRGVENSCQFDASAGLEELERRDPLGERKGGEVDKGDFGKTLTRRLEIQARRPKQLGGGTRA